MALAVRGSGAVTAVTTTASASVGLPTGWGAGDGHLLIIGTKSDTAGVAAPTAAGPGAGWTLLGTATGGTGGGSATTGGQVRLAVYFREAQAGDTDPNTGTFSAAPSPGIARVLGLTKGAGETWDLSALGIAGDTTGSTTGYGTVTSSANFTAAAGDFLFQGTFYNDDVGTFTSRTLDWPGVTLDAYTTVGITNAGSTAGNDAKMDVGYRAVSSGTPSSAPTFASVWTGAIANFSGASVFLRVRAAGATPTAQAVVNSETVSATALSPGWVLSAGTNARAVVSTASDLSSPVFGPSVAISSSGWVNSRVTGLAANTLYYVGVEVDGTIIATGRGQYRTLKNTFGSSVVIGGSCQNDGTDPAVFTYMDGLGADFFVHLGDLHYADISPYDDGAWRGQVETVISTANMASMLQSTPWAGYSPDNHDGPGVVAGVGPGIPDGVWEVGEGAAMRDLFGTAGTGLPSGGVGHYRTWVHAGVRHILTDNWSFKSDYEAVESAGKTMWGTTQRAWVLDLLQNSTEQAIIVWSSFPVGGAGAGRWSDYTTDSAAIAAFIAGLPAAQRAKIVFIGGDSHTIHADDGANTTFGVPSLNCSPFRASVGGTGGTWNIGSVTTEGTRGYFSRLTFTPDGTDLDMTWDAVRDDGTVMLTWSATFPAASAGANRQRIGDSTVNAIRISDATVSRVYASDTLLWP